MSFSVHVTPDLVPLEPGATTPISVVVVNKGTEADRYEMELEGIDPEWKAVPVAVFEVDPSETHSEKVFLKPGRTSESLAGNYPFVVKIRSLISGEQKNVQGVAQVKPFHHISLEIDPKKGSISPTKKQNSFGLTVVNLGNTEHTLQLLGTDPEDACAFEFDPEQIVIGPGQQKDVALIANPTSKPVLSSGHLIGFTVTARSVDTPSIVASAQAQLEQRPLLTPTSIAVFVLFALILGALYLVMPRPITLSLNIDRNQIQQGQTVNISWDAEHARRVTITAGDQQIYDGPDPRGQRPVTLTTAGTIIVHAEAMNGDQKKQEDKEVTVAGLPTYPPPTILDLTVSPTKVKLGQPFLMKYILGESVVQAALEPTGQVIDKALDRIQVTPDTVGDNEYTLVVKNAGGDIAKRSFTVSVYDVSDAQIIAFMPNKKVIDASEGKVTLNWQVTNAERVEIKEGDSEPVVVGLTGSQDFNMTAKTTFVLTAIDAKNRRATRQFTVSVNPLPDTATATPTGADGSTTAGGATTGGGTSTATTTTGSTGQTSGTTAGNGIHR
jgi:hypothetical protein